VITSGKLRVAVTAVSSFATVMGLAALPAASAVQCSVPVQLLSGRVENLQVAQGVPLSSVQLPLGAKIIGRESCPPPPNTVTTPATTTPTTTGTTPTTMGTTPTTTGTTPTSTTPSGGNKNDKGQTTPTTTTTTPSSTPPKPNGPGKSQRPSKHKAPAGTVGGSRPKSKPRAKGKPKAKSKPKASHKKRPAKNKPKPTPSQPQHTHTGVPTPSNPSFSFSLPGPAPIGVPNFFIDSFRIPPFLLPIYQAAGIQYDVPWQVLGGINEIETDYGRNLSVSSAGAVGWMQFLPSTWKEWGGDYNGDGVADPYNPVDAIFSAARYLHAAGASKNLAGAIFAYNHAGWYVQSVLLRAKLIGGMPSQIVGALAGLVEGHFPVAAPSKYAADAVQQLAKHHVKRANAAIPINSDPNATGVAIYAKQNAPVIAVNDGKVIKLGDNQKLGRYLELQDATGNVYTYANLGSIPRRYPVPKPVKVNA
jgi:hypothetical protein